MTAPGSEPVLVPPAPVPPLDMQRVADRRAALVASLDNVPPMQRRRLRAPLVGAGLAASAAAAAVLVLLSSTTAPVPNAFAGWTPKPSSVPVGEAGQVRAACLSAMASAPQDAGPGGWHVVLSEQRGPSSLLVMQRAESRVVCLRLADSGLSVRWLVGGRSPVTAGAAVVDSLSHAVRDGHGFTLVMGRAGRAVTSVAVHLADGRVVTASLAARAGGGASGRPFTAWWPGSSAPVSVDVTSPGGTSTQPAPRPAPSR